MTPSYIDVLEKAGYPTDCLVLDFETYFDDKYSLRNGKLTTIEYIKDSRFEVLGAAYIFAYPHDDPEQYKEESRWENGDCASLFKNWKLAIGEDFENVTVIMQNAMFDAAILAYRYGIYPPYIVDVLGLARAHNARAKNDLDSLAARFGLSQKGDTLRFKGWSNRERVKQKKASKKDPRTSVAVAPMLQEQQAALGDYAINDACLEWQLFCTLLSKLRNARQELRLMQHTIEMFTKPRLRLDFDRAATLKKEMEAERDRAIAKTGHTAEQIRGEKSFATLLESALTKAGDKVDKYTKPCARPNQEWQFAMSKADDEKDVLLAHPDSNVRELVEARVALKSWPLHIKRVDRLVNTARALDSRLAVPVKYHGAHCVTGEAEVLTPTGWCKLANWGGGPIMQWNEKGTLYFAEATNNVFLNEEPMVQIDSPYIKSTMTAGHKLPIFNTAKKYAPGQAANLLDRCISYLPISGRYCGSTVFSADQLRLFVAIQADGHWQLQTKYGRELRFGLTKVRKQERLRKLLAAVDIPWRESVFKSHPGEITFRIRWKDIPAWLRPEYKRFGPWLLHSGQEAMVAFVEELVHWDGSHLRPKNIEYTSYVPENLEWVCTICHLVGFAARRGKRNRLVIRTSRTPDKAIVTPKHIKIVPPVGEVYCPTTETGYWLIRDQGLIYITGNTGRYAGGDKLNLQNLPARGEGLTCKIRELIVPPPGHVLAVADASQIEARVLAWVAGQDDLCEAFRTGQDIYCDFATRVLGWKVRKPRDGGIPEIEAKYKWARNMVGKVGVLQCGYGSGAAKVSSTHKLPFDLAEKIVKQYREDNKAIVNFWYDLGDAFAMTRRGLAPVMNHLRFSRSDEIDVELHLPSRRALHYHSVRIVKGQAEIQNPMSGRWERTWGGATCLTGDTEVLTSRGWVCLDEVRCSDRVWDGVEWVDHGGVVFQGVRDILFVNGIGVTHDHKIRTTSGWVGAGAAKNLDWAEVWTPGYSFAQPLGWQTVVLECPLRLRERVRALWKRYNPQRQGGSRMSVVQRQRARADSRYVGASCILGLAEYARSVPTFDTSGVEKLRGSGDSSLQTMGEVREFLGGYGADIPTGVDARSNQQRRGLHSQELSVGDIRPTSKQSPVFDLLDCGPRKCFTVRDREGIPRLVHNCENVVQAIARDILTEAILRCEARGVSIALSVHDELIAVVEKDKGQEAVAILIEELTRPPAWAIDCPLAAEGLVMERYGTH